MCYMKSEEIKMQEVVGKAFQEREALLPPQMAMQQGSICIHILNHFASQWKSDGQV